MAITGAELLSDLGELLLDPDGDIWDSDFKVARINEGLNLIASLRPDTTAVTEALVLAQTAKQDLPTGGTRLLDVPMNTDGLPVRKINRESMNESVPSWSTTTGSAIEHFMFDEETPKVFWVYPVPATAAVSVQISYSKLPTVLLHCLLLLELTIYSFLLLSILFYRDATGWKLKALISEKQPPT